MFTLDELNEMTKDQLIKLAGYYKLDDFSKYWIKEKMIDAIWAELNPKVEVEDTTPPMSARVRRIYETNKE